MVFHILCWCGQLSSYNGSTSRDGIPLTRLALHVLCGCGQLSFWFGPRCAWPRGAGMRVECLHVRRPRRVMLALDGEGNGQGALVERGGKGFPRVI
jgi:hypothetical protein